MEILYFIAAFVALTFLIVEAFKMYFKFSELKSKYETEAFKSETVTVSLEPNEATYIGKGVKVTNFSPVAVYFEIKGGVYHG